MDEDSNLSPELKDIETKLGRKVPDSLIRSLVGGKHHDRHEKAAAVAAPHVVNGKLRASSADLKRLESKMLFLKQEMVSVKYYFKSRKVAAVFLKSCHRAIHLS